jgi:hypothetical protein
VRRRAVRGLQRSARATVKRAVLSAIGLTGRVKASQWTVTAVDLRGRRRTA